MTREEAIKIFRGWDGVYIGYSSDEVEEAHEIAINALSQEPCNDAEQIDYHDDFETALKKINDYEMTRDERAAMSILNAYKAGYESGMEDLEQEPCDDAISREAVQEAFAEYVASGFAESVADFEGYTDIIMTLPSVTGKSGKWIMSDDGLYRPICDKCGAHPWKGYIPSVEEATEVFKYCPNCGAKMESEEKE